MHSNIEYWSRAAINPWESYAGDFHCIAMDQRNTGRSTAPLDPGDPWGDYAADQLGLLDHLGIDRFLVMGCCIGCSFVLKLIERAPGRVAAAVLEQPIGVEDSNRARFGELQASWAEGRDGAEPFLASMWKRDFVVSVDRETISSCPVPLLVLPGIDEYHPTEAGREVAALAPHAEVIEPWKDSPEHIEAATEQVRGWLLTQAAGAVG